MSTTPVKKYMTDIENLQKKFSNFVNLKGYTPRLLAYDQSFVRFLCTKFKIEFYDALIRTSGTEVRQLVPFTNLLLLVRREREDGLKFYTTSDQTNLIETTSGKRKLISWLRRPNNKALAWATIKLVKGTDHAYFVHHDWHKSPLYAPANYPDFQSELEIYNIGDSK